MLYSHTFSFLLLIFANIGCSESVANEAVYHPAECAETVSLLPTKARTNPAESTMPTKGVANPVAENPLPKSPPTPDKKPAVADEKINVNIATLSELETLPGIGPALAKRISDYRTKRKFKRLRDIRRVKGIGNAKYKKLKDKIRIK